jgi:arylsulfatase
MANPNLANKSTKRSGTFADVIAEMDERVGQVADAVKDAGFEDNTIFILSSDNADGGAIPQAGPGSNGPWRGDFFYTPGDSQLIVRNMEQPAGRGPWR